MQHYDVVIIGAGFGGIGAAIQLKREGYENILIVDREDDLGGTWHVNHYPGLAVDQPSPTFSYWFEPNPYWSRMYAPGTELKHYAEFVADKYDVRRYMRFNTTVEGARWDDEESVWRIALAGGESLSAQFLVAATGFLCQPKMPDIPGIETFAGRIIHTAKWDDTYSLAGRRAAVIGTGSTGVQIIPELAEHVADLTVYQRTPIWVLPKMDVTFPAAVQRLFARVPLTQRILRWFTDTSLEFSMVVTMWNYRRFKFVNRGISAVSKLYRLLLVRGDRRLSSTMNPPFRDEFPGKRVVNALIDLPFALPTIVAGITLLALYGPKSPAGINVVGTRTAIVLALLFVTLPFVVRAVQPVLIELDREMEEAAASLGASGPTTFRRIILPNLVPAIVSGAPLGFARAVGEFGSVVLISGNIPFHTQVSAVYVYGQVESDATTSAAAASVVLLLVSVVVLAALRAIGGRGGR